MNRSTGDGWLGQVASRSIKRSLKQIPPSTSMRSLSQEMPPRQGVHPCWSGSQTKRNPRPSLCLLRFAGCRAVFRLASLSVNQEPPRTTNRSVELEGRGRCVRERDNRRSQPSAHHSLTSPFMSNSPHGLAAFRPTSRVEPPELPACQALPSKSTSRSPNHHRELVPAFAAYSHSASLGKRQ